MRTSTALTTALAITATGLVIALASSQTVRISSTASVPAGPLPGAQTAASQAAVRLVVAPAGNSARYLVREQLAGFDLPNDAIGVTSGVSGSIALDKSGAVIPAFSSILVNVGSLKSDKDRRDGFLRRRVLQTDSFPNVQIAVTRLSGVKAPIPTSGTRSFILEGNLTVRGVTRPTRWLVDAAFAGNTITGKASTKFTFAEFELTQPRVPVVLSVADTIRLEYDFTLQREGGGPR